ncbi:MAG: protein containing prepilin-type N- cleavage/methylation domain protein [Campylobacterales bacterium]|nr:protein containing prepilin-type N- cleavage/methylation domain protein [Campylobacterales bacterium]
MKFRSAFTMLELVFVIVIMGIIGKFGVEFLAQAYKGFIFTNVNNSLQGSSATAVEFISVRLQDRIKDSIIARKSSDNSFLALGSASGSDYDVLEWVGTDVDGFRGNSDATPNLPNWSGVIDIDLSSNTTLVSPATDTTKINELITILSDANSDMNDSALYFVGSSSDVRTGYGWDGNLTTINMQQETMHPVHDVSGQPTQFTSAIAFSEVYEYYKLAWTAYAVVHSAGNLTLYYDYQPWKGETYLNGKSAIIMENVDTFRFMAIGSLVKIQVCVNSNLVEEYSLCKEKTIY